MRCDDLGGRQGRLGEGLDVARSRSAVQRIGCGDDADQDEHDETHALLAVIGAVREGHAGAGEDQKTPHPERRGSLTLGLLVELGAADQKLHDQEQAGRAEEADERGQQQGIADLSGLAPVNARGAVTAAHQGVGDADADDRTDERVRARSRKAEPPGAEVPDDGRDEQRKDHREASFRTDLEDQFHRQQ